MRRVSLCFLIISILALMCGCSGGKSSENKNQEDSKLEDTTSDKSPIAENIRASNVYVKKKAEPGEGLYECTMKDGTTVELAIYRITKKNIWFAFDKGNAKLSLTRANRVSENTFQFFYEYDEKKDNNTFKESKKTEYEGMLVVLPNDGVVKVEIKGGKESYQLGFSGTMKSKKIFKSFAVCDILKCLGKYYETRQGIDKSVRDYIQLGKQKKLNQVQYIEIKPDKCFQTSDKSELIHYGLGELSFFSTKEECDAALGKPLKIEASERTYVYKNDYQVILSFDGNCLKSMGVYYKDRKAALQKYTVEDYTMQGCRVIKYNGNYDGKLVELPEDTVGIAKNAFKLEKNPNGSFFRPYKKNADGTNVKLLKLCIPKSVYIEPLAFAWCGPMAITFEEGRKVIERGAFCNFGEITDFRRTITLPQSVTKICDSAFEQSMGIWGTVEVVLNDAVKAIGNCALRGVMFDKLPKSLESLGDECIYISNPVKRLHIPDSLKKVGRNVISYGEEFDMDCTGVQVNKKNKYFKSDKNGWLYSKDGKTLYLAFSNRMHIEVPDSVEKAECDFQEWPDSSKSLISWKKHL